MNTNLLTATSMVLLLTIGIGVGWGFQTTVVPTSGGSVTTTSTGQQGQSGPYMLNLVEIMQNMWNSSGLDMQPAFYVLGAHGLESSANISIPANRLIQVTIVSYDTPEPDATTSEGVVSGTVGGTVYVINGTVAAGTANVTMAADWGQNVTAVPASELSHTFSIQQLGIGIPVVAGSTVIAYIEIHQTGNFSWVCLTPCGLGDNGLAGAMVKPGWMAGNLHVT